MGKIEKPEKCVDKIASYENRFYLLYDFSTAIRSESLSSMM